MKCTRYLYFVHKHKRLLFISENSHSEYTFDPQYIITMLYQVVLINYMSIYLPILRTIFYNYIILCTNQRISYKCFGGLIDYGRKHVIYIMCIELSARIWLKNNNYVNAVRPSVYVVLQTFIDIFVPGNLKVVECKNVHV